MHQNKVSYSAYILKYSSIRFPVTHKQRWERICLEIYCILKCICIRVCPNLICQYIRFSPGLSLWLFVFLTSHPIYPTLHLQNHGHLLKTLSLQLHPAVMRYQLSAISYLWMSLDIINQGATGQQQTSILSQVLSLSFLSKHGSRRQPPVGRGSTNQKKERKEKIEQLCAILIYLYGSRTTFLHM